MSQVDSRYALSTTTELGFTDAVTRVREELANEGFGVLCEIDVQATLKQKLGIDREPYLILGACNPPLAHAALEAEPELGVLLPCNVVVYQQQARRTSPRSTPSRCSPSSATTNSPAPPVRSTGVSSTSSTAPRRSRATGHPTPGPIAGAKRCCSPVNRRSLLTRPRHVSPTADWCSSMSATASRSSAVAYTARSTSHSHSSAAGCRARPRPPGRVPVPLRRPQFARDRHRHQGRIQRRQRARRDDRAGGVPACR